MKKCQLFVNKTRGLRRWPTRETIVLRGNKLNPGSTEIFEINVRNSELFGASVPTSQEFVHKNSERYLIQSWRYSYICWISLRMYANYQADRHTKNLELFGTSVPMSRNVFKKIQKDTSLSSGFIPLSNFGKKVSKQTD